MLRMYLIYLGVIYGLAAFTRYKEVQGADLQNQLDAAASQQTSAAAASKPTISTAAPAVFLVPSTNATIYDIQPAHSSSSSLSEIQIDKATDGVHEAGNVYVKAGA